MKTINENNGINKGSTINDDNVNTLIIDDKLSISNNYVKLNSKLLIKSDDKTIVNNLLKELINNSNDISLTYKKTNKTTKHYIVENKTNKRENKQHKKDLNVVSSNFINNDILANDIEINNQNKIINDANKIKKELKSQNEKSIKDIFVALKNDYKIEANKLMIKQKLIDKQLSKHDIYISIVDNYNLTKDTKNQYSIIIDYILQNKLSVNLNNIDLSTLKSLMNNYNFFFSEKNKNLVSEINKSNFYKNQIEFEKFNLNDLKKINDLRGYKDFTRNLNKSKNQLLELFKQYETRNILA